MTLRSMPQAEIKKLNVKISKLFLVYFAARAFISKNPWANRIVNVGPDLVPSPFKGARILKSTKEVTEILAKTNEHLASVELLEDGRQKFTTTSDNVYVGKNAKNSYLILSYRSESGMNDCRHVSKLKYRRWRGERKCLEIVRKHRKKCLKIGGHFLLLTEIRLLNSIECLKKLTLEDLALSIRYVEKFGDHRDGSKHYSVMAYLAVHSETVLTLARAVEKNKIQTKKENTKFKKIANNLVFLAEKFGPTVTIAEALERINGNNVINLNERKAA